MAKPGPLRADAARNRARLVETASVVFSERGLDAPLDEIARRAGVGNATLYRRFPTRCDLVAAVYTETMRSIVEETSRALDDPDPWAGFAAHVTFLCGIQAENRALADLLIARVGGAPELERLRARALEGLLALIERAQAAGELRADFGHDDVVLLLMANSGLLERTASDAPDAWRRHLGFVLDGLRAPGGTPVDDPPSARAVRRAMGGIATRLGLRSQGASG